MSETKIGSELQHLLDALAQANAQALSSAMSEHSRQADPTLREREYPAISPLNPEGDLKSPRPEIKGEVFFVGWRMDSRSHTREEIELINALKPGVFYIRGASGDTVKLDIIDLEPGAPGSRKLYIHVPHQSADDRARLPSSLVDLCRQAIASGDAKAH